MSVHAVARVLVLAALAIALTAAACSHSPPQSSSDPGTEPVTGAAEPATQATESGIEPTGPTEPVTEPTEPVTGPSGPASGPVASSTPTWRGDSCQADVECAWDHPCFPRRCVAADQPGPVTGSDCDKTIPAPGQCECVDNMCTVHPDQPERIASTDTGCRSDAECAVDVSSATCYLGGNTRIGPIDEQGPVCTCDQPSDQRSGQRLGTCVFSWSGPVTCQSWRDCSWVREPRLRPVSAKQVPRPIKRKVRPCRDSELDSVCTDAGVCRIMAWRC